jgi:hypothetical protein
LLSISFSRHTFAGTDKRGAYPKHSAALVLAVIFVLFKARQRAIAFFWLTWTQLQRQENGGWPELVFKV